MFTTFTLAYRLKCWECGVKKKAPCGQTQRDDLPWCCHRRLGEWIAIHSVARADNNQKSIAFASKPSHTTVHQYMGSHITSVSGRGTLQAMATSFCSCWPQKGSGRQMTCMTLYALLRRQWQLPSVPVASQEGFGCLRACGGSAAVSASAAARGKAESKVSSVRPRIACVTLHALLCRQWQLLSVPATPQEGFRCF